MLHQLILTCVIVECPTHDEVVGLQQIVYDHKNPTVVEKEGHQCLLSSLSVVHFKLQGVLVFCRRAQSLQRQENVSEHTRI